MWVLLALLSVASADESSHTYQNSEPVILWHNKVVPYNNPQESYAYHKLPLCRGWSSAREHTYSMSLGEAVEGYELTDSQMEIPFLQRFERKEYCSLQLDHEKVVVLVTAIRRNFWSQSYIDDLPVWTNLGKVEDGTDDVYIYTHFEIVITYNQNQIIQARIKPDKPIRIYDTAKNAMDVNKITFTYSLDWIPTDIPFSKRFESYLDPGFFENNIHWLSIFNSFVIVLLMCGLVAAILGRMLKSDYAQYELQDLEPIELAEPTGWKQVAGEVFRPPEYLTLFTVLISSGYQLAALLSTILLASLVHPMYAERGEVTTMAIIAYAFLGIVGGLKGGNFYSQHKGKNWKVCMMLTAWFVPGIVFGVVFMVNNIAILYSSSAAIPFTSVLEIIFLYVVVHQGTNIAGTLLGRNFFTNPDYPCKVNIIKQPILREKKWYNEPIFLILVGGLLPFGSVSVETYFIFTSFWNYKFYYVYGFGFLAFVLLCLTMMCVSIVASYIILNSEDYRWMWVSFLSSASLGLYFFMYSIYYYLFRTRMAGLFQFAYYFGYTGLASVLLGLVSGSVGYTGAHYFVRFIYHRVKHD